MRDPVPHPPTAQNNRESFGASCGRLRLLSTPLHERYGWAVGEILSLIFRDPQELAHYHVLVDMLEERGEFDFALGIRAGYLDDGSLTRSQKERILFSLWQNHEHLSLWFPQTTSPRWEVLPNVIPHEVVVPPEALHPSLHGFGAIVPLQLVSDGYGQGPSPSKFADFRRIMNDCLERHRREAISGMTIVDFAYHGLNCVVRGSGSKGKLASIQEISGVLTHLWREARVAGFFLSDRVYDALGAIAQSLGANGTPERTHVLGSELIKIAIQTRQSGQNVGSIMEHGLLPYIRATKERLSVELLASVGKTLIDTSQEVARLRRSTVRFFRDSFGPLALALRDNLTESRLGELRDLALEAEERHHQSHYLRELRTARSIAILEALGNQMTPSRVEELHREFRHFEELFETQFLAEGTHEAFRRVIRDLGPTLTPCLVRELCREVVIAVHSLPLAAHADIWGKLHQSGYFHIFSEFGSHLQPALLRRFGETILNHIRRCDAHQPERAGLSILRLTFENLGSAITPEIVAAIEEGSWSIYRSEPDGNNASDRAAEREGGAVTLELFERTLANSLRNNAGSMTPDVFRHLQRDALAVAQRANAPS